MAIEEMGFGKVVLVCVVAAVSTFAATGIAIVLAGASSESAIGSKANRATAPGTREMGHGQRASRFQQDRETLEDTSLVAQAGYLERAPSSSETASAAAAAPTDAS